MGPTEAVEPANSQRAPTIVLDGLRITDAEIVYGDFHIFKVWALDQKPALIIGMDVLGTLASLEHRLQESGHLRGKPANGAHSLGMTQGQLNNMSIKH